ncbi:hypothetical protein LUZ60_004160 [Juncus effusus]|nr:hypothetical protein LUZ60_004160 [Juncus effusus]
MSGRSGNPFPDRILSFFSRPTATSSSTLNAHRPYNNLGLLAVLPEETEYSNKKHFLTSSSSISTASSHTATWQIPTCSNGATHRVQRVEEISVSAPVRVPAVRNGMERSAGCDVLVQSPTVQPVRSPRVRVMIPPHEMVVGSMGSHSVLEGVGRTLKGRDLRRVRDTVHHITGFNP